MAPRARPLSPHLEIYRWQISNTLSIFHRVTGAILAVGLIALSVWFVAIAGGPESYATAVRFFGSPVGILFLIGWSFAFYFHLSNGVRHLFWDAGRGFEKSRSRASGWFAVAASLMLTLGTWIWFWGHLS